MSADVVKDERMANIMPMNKNKKKLAGKIVAACAAIAIIFGGAAFFAGNALTESKITIDVNPSVEIITGKSDKLKRLSPSMRTEKLSLTEWILKTPTLI